MYKHKQVHNPHRHIKPLPPDKLEQLLYGETIPDQHTKKRLEESRKGTLIMPSLQDALQSALQQQTITQTIAAWDDDNKPQAQPQPQPEQPKENTMKQLFQPSNGITRAIFNYVVEHPNCTREQVRAAIINLGYNKDSVSSLIAQNVRSGNFQEIDGKLSTTLTEYRPASYKGTKRGERKKASAIKKQVRIAKRQAILGTPIPTPAGITALTQPAAPAPMTLNAQYILDTLPIKQARELYDELHKIFGAGK